MKFSISLTLFLSPFTVYFVICFSSLNGPNSFASTLLKKKEALGKLDLYVLRL